MSENNLKAYLFLLRSPSQSAMEAACWQARKLNLVVSGIYRNDAITVLTNATQAKRLKATELFLHHTNKAIPASVLKKLKNAQASIAEFWNHRFSEEYIKHQEQSEKQKGVSWDKNTETTPAFFAKFDPKMVIKKTKVRLKEKKIKTPRGPVERFFKRYEIDYNFLGRAAIVKLVRSWLKKKYHPHMTGVIYRMCFSDVKFVLEPESAETVNEVVSALETGTPCRTLHGVISVGLIFVDSAANNIAMTLAQQNTVMADIVAGNDWVASEHPSGNLAFVYDIQRVTIGISNRPNSTEGPDPAVDQYWRDPAMGQVSYNGLSFPANLNGVQSYKDAMQSADNSDDAVVYFITRFGSSWQAYSDGESHIVISQFDDNWLMGIPDLSHVAAHELLHQYGAMDEYDGTLSLGLAFGQLPDPDNVPANVPANVQGSYGATPCMNCGDLGGCDHIPNGNCESCAEPFRPCIMQSRRFDMCQYTRGQIGWADIFVELETDNVYYGGTTDNVFLDIGTRSFLLPRNYSQERKKGFKDAYAIFENGSLTRDQIKRIIIRKEEDSAGGGWKLRQVKVFHDCEEICFDLPLRWLQNDELYYLAPSYPTDDEHVNTLVVRVITGDRRNAGLNGNVNMTIGAFNWDIESNQNDFGRNSSRDYELDPMTNFRVADIETIRINKTSGGDWFLGGLQLIVNGDVIYSNLTVNTWLRNNPSSFTDTL